MDGKIALEEHMALPETLDDSMQIVGAAPGWEQLRDQLLDIGELRLEQMDKHGIEVTLVSLNAPAVQAIVDRQEAAEISTRANDHLAEQVAKNPDRFRGFAALPMQDPELASKELARCVNDLGFVGALVNGFTQRDVSDSVVYYDIPEYRSFWATVAELDVPFYLHPRAQIKERDFATSGHPWLETAVWGFARETSIHSLRLCGSGLFDEYPGLKVVLGHLGERIPYDLWRIDARMKVTGADYKGARPIGQVFREHFHITTSGNFSDTTLRCCLDEMGVDHLMFSVDYPFEQTDEAATWYDDTPVLDEQQRRQIGRDNANKLFKLGLD